MAIHTQCPPIRVTLVTILILLGTLYLTSTRREGFLGFGKKAKQSSETNVVFNDIKEKITEMTTNNSVDIDQSAFNSAKLSFRIGSSDNCNISGSNTIDSKSVVVVDITDEMATQLEEDIKMQLQQGAAAVAEKETDIVGTLGSVFGGGTDSEVKSNIDTEIKDITKDVFKKNNLTKIKNSVVNKGDGEVVMDKCKNSTIVVDNNIMNTVITESIMDNLSKKIQKSKLAKIVEQEGAAASSQKDTTISDFTGMITDIFQGAYMAYVGASCASACAICGCCIIVGVVAMNMSPDQMTAAGTQAQAAAPNLRHVMNGAGHLLGRK